MRIITRTISVSTVKIQRANIAENTITTDEVEIVGRFKTSKELMRACMAMYESDNTRVLTAEIIDVKLRKYAMPEQTFIENAKEVTKED